MRPLAGNYVLVEGEEGVAFYAHLRQRSVCVEEGQCVRRGDLIGKVGNSGNSTQPHLHFHLMDSPSPLGSNGIPFVFESYTLAGAIPVDDFDANVAAGGPFALDTADAGAQTELYPIWLTVTDFAD